MRQNRRGGASSPVAKHHTSKEGAAMRQAFAALILLVLLFVTATRVGAAEGQMTWAVHISLAPTWFDPAETPGIVTPFMILYALHDAMAKPMPGKAMAPSLAESWTVSPDGLTYDLARRARTLARPPHPPRPRGSKNARPRASC